MIAYTTLSSSVTHVVINELVGKISLNISSQNPVNVTIRTALQSAELWQTTPHLDITERRYLGDFMEDSAKEKAI